MFYGQWNPPVDQVLFENYFKTKRNGFFVEAGASDGVILSCCKFFEDQMGWTGINFEPAKEYYRRLELNRRNCININSGLSDKTETLVFRDVISPGCAGVGNGSFSHSTEHLNELNRYGCSYNEYEVSVVSYSDIISQYNIPTVDLMCLDVEGHEFKVIDGMAVSTVLPSIMCIEYSYIGIYVLIDYMKKIGYHFNFISFNNAYFSLEKPDRTDWFGKGYEEYAVTKEGGTRISPFQYP